MNEIVSKLRVLEQEIAAERGPFILFALFLREEAPNRWDLVVAAPWFGSDKMETLRYLADRLQARLTPEEVVLLSRIVIINEDNPYLEDVSREIQVEHALVEIRDRVFFGQQIERGYVITSNGVEGVPTVVG
jgi:hypothetical protein